MEHLAIDGDDVELESKGITEILEILQWLIWAHEF